MVTVVGIEVTGDNVLEVSVLPVQVAGLDSSCKNSPVGTHLCRETVFFFKKAHAGIVFF